MLKRVEISALRLFQSCLSERVEISTQVQFDMFLACNLNVSFNSPWIMSNHVKIVQNSAEKKVIKLKCKHKKDT